MAFVSSISEVQPALIKTATSWHVLSHHPLGCGRMSAHGDTSDTAALLRWKHSSDKSTRSSILLKKSNSKRNHLQTESKHLTQ